VAGSTPLPPGVESGRSATPSFEATSRRAGADELGPTPPVVGVVVVVGVVGVVVVAGNIVDIGIEVAVVVVSGTRSGSTMTSDELVVMIRRSGPIRATV